MTPTQVANQLALLGTVKWFDNNPLASEYLYPENWSPWDWVQIGGSPPQLTAPLQANLNPLGLNLPGLFTFLGEVKGDYEIHIDKKTTPGKPAVNTALFAKANEIHIRLYLITPFDLLQIKVLLPFACAIFPATSPQANPTVVPIYHPKLVLFQRTSFILVKMSYPYEPRDGKPGYVDSTWLPQDIVGAQSQIGTFAIGIPKPAAPAPSSIGALVTPPPAPNPDTIYEPLWKGGGA